MDKHLTSIKELCSDIIYIMYYSPHVLFHIIYIYIYFVKAVLISPGSVMLKVKRNEFSLVILMVKCLFSIGYLWL